MAQQSIESGVTRIPGTSGDTVVTVQTGQKPHVTHQDEHARWNLLQGLLDHPEIPVSADMIQRQVLFAALSPEKREFVRGVEELLGDQIGLPGAKPNPLYVEAVRRLEEHEAREEKRARQAQMSMLSHRPERNWGPFQHVRTIIRWIDRVLQPEGGEHFGDLR